MPPRMEHALPRIEKRPMTQGKMTSPILRYQQQGKIAVSQNSRRVTLTGLSAVNPLATLPERIAGCP